MGRALILFRHLIPHLIHWKATTEKHLWGSQTRGTGSLKDRLTHGTVEHWPSPYTSPTHYKRPSYPVHHVWSWRKKYKTYKKAKTTNWRDMEILRNNQKEMLEIKNTVTEKWRMPLMGFSVDWTPLRKESLS